MSHTDLLMFIPVVIWAMVSFGVLYSVITLVLWPRFYRAMRYRRLFLKRVNCKRRRLVDDAYDIGFLINKLLVCVWRVTHRIVRGGFVWVALEQLYYIILFRSINKRVEEEAIKHGTLKVETVKSARGKKMEVKKKKAKKKKKD